MEPLNARASGHMYGTSSKIKVIIRTIEIIVPLGSPWSLVWRLQSQIQQKILNPKPLNPKL